jgi:PAS domain S-box-containing protein
MSATNDSVRVLHVDDRLDVTELASTFLEREAPRFDVETAASASEGLERLEGGDLDCIVSDYDMPGRNGLEFLEAVREDHPDLPFILFTGKGSEEVASEAISAGVTDYLQKGSGTEQYELLANRVSNAVDAHRSRRMLTERTRQLETLISNLPGTVYRRRNEPDWPLETVEGEVERLTGYSADTLERDGIWGEEVLHPRDRGPVWDAVQEALSGDGTFEVTYRIVTRDGTTKWVWERGRSVRADDGEPEILEGFITEITDRKEREERLERTTARLEALFENSPDMINVHDTEGNVIDPNPRLCERTGYEASELQEMKVWDLDQRLDAEEARVLWEEMDVGDRRRLEGAYRCRDGETFPVEVHIRRLNLEGEDRFVVISRDVTERTERERELERYETLVETAAGGVFVQNEDARYTYVNSYIEERTGYDREQLLGQHPSLLIPDEDVRAISAEIGEMLEGDRESVTFETEITTATGETIPAEGQLALLPADDGFGGTVGVIRDISNRKEREEALRRQKERLEEFASVVSHDLRNPLNVAQGRLELTRAECESEHLDALERALERMNTLIENLLTLAREGEGVGELMPIDLAALAENCWRTVETTHATLVTETDRTIRADRSRLQQLLENLVRNAVEHGSTSSRPEHGATGSGSGGHGDAADHDDVTVRVGDLADGFYVADDGPGIPEERRDEVFRTGYSTSDEGTGFGLSIVETIAETHGWEITVADGDAGGARFEITGVEFVGE